MTITVDSDLTVAAGHHVAEDVRHALIHGVRRLDTVLVHVDPSSHDGEDHHAELRHHEASAVGRAT
jgi:divalent metal cation (Fe/Co/Zn/Cd) transporter